MSKSKFYTLQPARGQALLSFQNRRFPKAKMELFEVEKIEEVRATKKQSLPLEKKSLPIKEESLERPYPLTSNKFKIKIRNIAGDEIILSEKEC